MAKEGSKDIGLGAFILGGLALLIGFIYYIGANQNLFGSTTEITSVFKNISGLQPGANVRFSGINVGTVENITITTDSTVKVDMRLDNKVVPYMKKDGQAAIGSDGLMGDKVINLSPGRGGKSIEGGDKIASVEPMEMDAIIAKAAQMAEGVNTITQNVADMTSTIRKGKGTIGMLLYDDKAARETRGLLASLNRTAGSLNRNLKNTERGTEAFSENMVALQDNFLLRGYFKKKERAQQEVKDRAEEIKKLKAEELADSANRDSRSYRKRSKKLANLQNDQAKQIAEIEKSDQKQQRAMK